MRRFADYFSRHMKDNTRDANGRMECTYPCSSLDKAKGFLYILRISGFKTYDPFFSDGALTFHVDARYYGKVRKIIKLGRDKDA